MSASPLNQELPIIVRGNDWVRSVYLHKDNTVPWPIPMQAVVKAIVMDRRGLTAFTSEVLVSSAATGSDWDAGKIVLSISANETAKIPKGLSVVRLEIKVTTDYSTSWFAEISADTSLIN